MIIGKKHYTSIWYDSKKDRVKIIDQTLLPHKFKIKELYNLNHFIRAIFCMEVRGAPLIGVTAAYGMYFASKKAENFTHLKKLGRLLINTRPTAVNLKWAVDKIISSIDKNDFKNRKDLQLKVLSLANQIRIEDIENCYRIGSYGSDIIYKYSKKKNTEINILTHCNAGWLATVDWGTALAPIYFFAKNKNKKINIWVDETRPRNQGANLTSFELTNEGIKNVIIADNTGGLLMMKKKIDLCIVGADRVTTDGSVINKIGTYLKALAAYENKIPFFVALPYSTIDFKSKLPSTIEIEDRGDDEMKFIKGIDSNGKMKRVRIYPKKSLTLNLGFDITPSKFITGYITDKGFFNKISDFSK